jgi:hypothetical protein
MLDSYSYLRQVKEPGKMAGVSLCGNMCLSKMYFRLTVTNGRTCSQRMSPLGDVELLNPAHK